MVKQKTKGLVLAGLFTALGLILPQFFHLFSMGGPVFLPMHIPVLLAGFICGPQLGLLCGLLTPLLSSLLTQMPALYPMGVIMMCELAVYGFVSGYLSKRTGNTILSLIGAMLCGRAMSGLMNTILLGMLGKGYSLSAFMASAFITAWPGIVIQLVAIPVIITLVKKLQKKPL